MLHPTFLAPALAALLASVPRLVAADASSNVSEPAQFFPQYNSQRVKMRYGPFTVASMAVNNGMADFQQEGIQLPCTDCLITWMQAGLEYPNGTVANADTNLWLHHTVLANMNRSSTVCPGAGNPDTFFASGNERTAINICVNGTEQAGYYIAPTDELAVVVELMNMLPTNQTGMLTMTYEYIPHPPSSFSRVKALWLDIGGCNGSSDQPVLSTTQAFNYTSPAWTSGISGKVTFIGGHLHDGGTQLRVLRNGTEECDCVATYGANAAYIGGGMSMMSSMTMRPRDTSMAMSMSMSMPNAHILVDGHGLLVFDGYGLDEHVRIAKQHVNNAHLLGILGTDGQHPHLQHLDLPGDVWTITAYYDPSQHDLMLDANGTAAPIMGIALVYVADLNVTSTSSASGGSGTPSSSSTSTSGAGAVLAMGSEGMMMCLGLGWMVLMGTML
ncbi:hypothetical protein B0A55_09906 [Friedmanniomyces simplex]|uniref:Uncharacterized protein n=1 Tax=Friedmanniomyces simplex TaxID=329884 RepID=A0A4U0WTF7_9PEZI|nr:hypothetical protein B0A55_09906 [Friedmanniomyces simplex]